MKRFLNMSRFVVSTTLHQHWVNSLHSMLAEAKDTYAKIGNDLRI